MWANPQFSGLPLPPLLAPSIGGIYSNTHFPTWLPGNFSPAVNNTHVPSRTEPLIFPRLPLTEIQRSMINPYYNVFYPPFYPLGPIHTGIPGKPENRNDQPEKSEPSTSRSSMGVLEAEVAKINRAMKTGESNEKYSRFINRPGSFPLSPTFRPTLSRVVLSPPITGADISIESPNAASTPARNSIKAQPTTTADGKTPLRRKSGVHRAAAKINSDDHPLDLRVHKRSSADTDEESPRDAKRRKKDCIPLCENIPVAFTDSTYSYGGLLSNTHRSPCCQDSGIQENSKTDSLGGDILACAGPKSNSFGLDMERTIAFHESRKSMPFGEGSDIDSCLTEEGTNDSGVSGVVHFSGRTIKTVNGEKVYKCPHPGCEKSFATKSTLKHHAFVHTDTFKCSWPNCGKRFRDDYNLRTHYMTHTGQKPRHCSLCEYTCVQKNSMNWHMKTKHKYEEMVQEC